MQQNPAIIHSSFTIFAAAAVSATPRQQRHTNSAVPQPSTPFGGAPATGKRRADRSNFQPSLEQLRFKNVCESS